MKVTVLGCGAGGGVPTLTGDWGRCNPENPKNQRTRSSVLVEDQGTSVLIDFGPDLRQQFLRTGFSGKLDAAILTHIHADHSHGIDDLRRLYWVNDNKALPIYSTMQTRDMLMGRFAYAFEPFKYGDQFRPPLNCVVLPSSLSTTIGHLSVTSFTQDHVHMPTSGIRIGDFAYSVDVKRLGNTAKEHLKGIKVWIVECQSWEGHSSHAHFDQVIEWVEEIKPERTFLTHMGPELDYDELKSKCPEGVEPAHDGLIIEV